MLKIKWCKHDAFIVFTNSNFGEYTFHQIKKNDNFYFYKNINY